MGKSKDLATGNSAAYVETAGDTMSGTLNVNGGNIYLAEDDAAAHRYMFLNTGASQDGHIVLQRGLANKYQVTAKTDNSYSIYGYPASGEVFNINSSGIVTKPYQPAFMAYGSGTYTNRGTGAIEYSTAVFNQGNHYSTSTYTFTAPVSGVYHFSAGAIAHASFTAAGGIFIEKNSTHYLKDYQETGSRSRTVSGTINCAANDAIKVRIESSGSGGDYYYLGAGYGWFSGHLIG
tara:strand:+ start:244 stop:945 length:702 start_codon:yes stop_codon:yes gene_type:complete